MPGNGSIACWRCICRSCRGQAQALDRERPGHRRRRRLTGPLDARADRPEFRRNSPRDRRSAPRIAQPIALDIRFEDAHLIVIDKPAGMVVHPAPGNPDGTLVNALLAHCGAEPLRHRRGAPAGHRPSPRQGHQRPDGRRQDRARAPALSRDFAARRIERAYAAFVWGVPSPPAGEIAGNIGRSTANRKKMAVVGEGGGKPALTRYRVERGIRRQRSAGRMPARRPAAPIRSGCISRISAIR